MKIRKFAAVGSALAVFMTGTAAVPLPSAFAEDVEIGFFDDFEGYDETGDSHTEVDTMNDLYSGGWSIAADSQFTERNEADTTQRFARIIYDGDNKVLELTSSKSLGRMLDPENKAPSGSYEISFKFRPVDLGKKQMLFDISLNSFDQPSNIAKHNVLYSYNGMRMGHRTNNINVPMTQVGASEAVWYDVRCVVNNDGGYYSVELYKEGSFVARRGGINYAGDEKIGFLKLSGFGNTILVDDVSIRPCEREMLIYEDDFEAYSEVRLPSTSASVGASVTEAQSREGESFFEGHTPWRALGTFGNSYDLVVDQTRGSQVVRLGDDSATAAQESTGMMLMALDGEYLTAESQAKRGKLKLSYKFRHFSQNGYASAVDIISDYRYSGKWDYPPQMAIQEKGLSRPAVAGLPYLRTNDAPVKINQDRWYDADVIFDVISDEVTVIVREDGGAEIAHFTHNTNWINPQASPIFDKVKGLNFRAVNGSAVYIDDVRLEYYITDPEVTGSNIVFTDHRGERATDKNSIPISVKSIELPFGCEMTEESTNPDTVTITDSKGDSVAYSPVYGAGSYTMIPSGFLAPGQTYTIYVPASVENSFGRRLGTDFEYTFKTAPDYPELMTLSSASVTDLSEVRNGQTVIARIDYVNSTDGPIGCLPFIAYYGDDMLLATSGADIGEVGEGESGSRTVSFTVPEAPALDMSRVDKISLCLWKGFKNSAPYCAAIDVLKSDELETASVGTAAASTEPAVTYSYNSSTVNISGKADAGSRYMTVQIIRPGSSFDEGDGLAAEAADALVFYRAQVPVVNGGYSLDISYDAGAPSFEAGSYPAAFFIDDTRLALDSIYLSSASDYAAVVKELNDAAAAGDLDGFKNILNTKRSALNFNSELLGDGAVGNEIRSYFEYVKKNPLNAENEAGNSEMFNTYIAIEQLNAKKLDDARGEIDRILIAEDVKALCDEVLTTAEKGRYFTGLISGRAVDSPDGLEKCINEALILTTARYGNGYGELKSALETCGQDIGIKSPVSVAACRTLMGRSFSDAASFKRAYNDAAESASGSGSGGGGGGGSGGGGGGSSSGSSGSASKKPSVASVQTPVSGEASGKSEVEPVKMTFNDIDNYEWAMTGILGLADRNIINGVEGDRFEPARNITREEFVKILVGATGVSDHEYHGNIFNDVADDAWFVRYINTAAELGIVNGIGDGRFGAGSSITRQDMAVMIYNALRYRGVDVTPGSFRFDDDGQIAGYAKDAVAALYSMGAINGVTDTTFEPTGLATRAQAAKIVYSVLKELQG